MKKFTEYFKGSNNGESLKNMGWETIDLSCNCIFAINLFSPSIIVLFRSILMVWLIKLSVKM